MSAALAAVILSLSTMFGAPATDHHGCVPVTLTMDRCADGYTYVAFVDPNVRSV